MISARDVSIGFAKENSVSLVFDSLSFQVREGEWVGLIGFNGSGKSTLLHVLAGIAPSGVIPIISGKIKINHVLLHDLSWEEHRSLVQIVLQNPATQLTQGSIARELVFPLENMGIEKDQALQALASLLEAFEFHIPLHREIKALSSGEKQITNLLASQGVHPRILLLDEPTSFLDKKSSRVFLKYLRDLKTRNPTMTVIIATHYLEQYLLLLDKVLVIQNKQVREYLIPQDLVEEKINEVLWQYLPLPVILAIKEGKHAFTYGINHAMS